LFLENFKTLWSPKLRRITIMSWLLWVSVTFCSYAFFTWIPSLLVERGMTITKSFSFSIIIDLAQIPGYFSAAWVCERIGRQYTIIGYMIFAALCAIALAFVQSDFQVVAMSVMLSFFINGVNAGEYAYTPEVFPTRVRATGVGDGFGNRQAGCHQFTHTGRLPLSYCRLRWCFRNDDRRPADRCAFRAVAWHPDQRPISGRH
jgi:MFS family permease